jgi:hypothetical protein
LRAANIRPGCPRSSYIGYADVATHQALRDCYWVGMHSVESISMKEYPESLVL